MPASEDDEWLCDMLVAMIDGQLERLGVATTMEDEPLKWLCVILVLVWGD